MIVFSFSATLAQSHIMQSLGTISFVIEVLGIIAFTISGVFAALERRLDIFGVIVIAFVTSLGGGTVRDVLIGATPVAWMKDTRTLLLILATTGVTLLFKNRIGNFNKTLFFFDALGLGLFTVIGMEKGQAVGLNPGICIVLGTITGCFGGLVRDILLNHIPALLHTREIYATACITGGIVYFLLNNILGDGFAEIVAVAVICLFRIIAYLRNWRLPSI